MLGNNLSRSCAEFVLIVEWEVEENWWEKDLTRKSR